MRFEINARDGLARRGELELDGVVHGTPTIAFVDTWKHTAPKDGLKLRQSSLAKEGDIGISPSGFSLSPHEGEPEIEVGYRGSPFAADVSEGGFAILDGVSGLSLDSRRFVDAIEAMKNRRLLKPAFCPVIGLPSRLAFLSYCGIDVFDSIPLIMAAENGQYLNSDGAIPVDRIKELPCECASCAEGIADVKGLLKHNISVATNELRLVRNHIALGTLRELVESRIRAETWQVQSLRVLDLEHSHLQEVHAPIKGARFTASSKESLHRPDVARWRRRLVDRYRRPDKADTLVLLPCSARKPYSISPSHRRFRDAIFNSGRAHAVHEVIVTSPLGLVPRELELFYPARDYDIPVTGHWDRDEQAMVQELVRWLVESQRYKAIISHLGSERDLVNEVVDDCIDTSDGDPNARGSLSKLEDTVREQAPNGGGGTRRRTRAADDLSSIARFQFGDAGDALTAGASAAGRWPAMKIVRDGIQLGAVSHQRGMISMTLPGAAIVGSKDAYCVEIDDFLPKGNLFAIGVEDATDDIRIGDDAVIRHAGDVRAVGVARMTPVEMRAADRGEAVHIRHRAR
ncbi:MAG: DUF5591 domain-containing protein [Methanobacteriota archaeon]|nr:MAG: DUF5591 domain-containing protein [Euryarchaeota archaeon]